jgi:hypothetical protein
VRTFRTLPPHSPARQKAINSWKPFFTEIAEQIKNTQMTANTPILEKQVNSGAARVRTPVDK